MKSFKFFMKESLIDPVQDTLSKQIFDKTDTPNPIMKKRVKGFIMRGIGDLEDIARILDIQIVGSILTRQFALNADIDVNILFKPFGDAQTVLKRLRKRAAKINGAKVTGTKHSVNYFSVVSQEVFDRASELTDAAYDLNTDKWLKKAKAQPFDPDKYIEEFDKAASKLDIMKDELVRDIADFKQLQSLKPIELSKLSQKVNGKVQELEKDMKDIIDTHQLAKQVRRDIFSKPLSPKEIKDYGSKNALPENVIFKLLERFLYWNLASKLKEIIGDDKKLSKPEAKKLKNVKVPPDAKGRLKSSR